MHGPGVRIPSLPLRMSNDQREFLGRVQYLGAVTNSELTAFELNQIGQEKPLVGLSTRKNMRVHINY